MKTVNIPVTPKALAAFVNICDIALGAGRLQILPAINLVVPLLEQAQIALNEQSNGEQATDLEGNT